MNLHGMASDFIGTVNPFVEAQLRRSTGYTTQPNGHRLPSYSVSTMMVQVQSLTAEDLKQIDSLNIQGVMRSIYLDGDWRGVVRKLSAGGDVFVIGTDVWLVVHALETWPDWSKVAVVLQMEST